MFNANINNLILNESKSSETADSNDVFIHFKMCNSINIINFETIT